MYHVCNGTSRYSVHVQVRLRKLNGLYCSVTSWAGACESSCHGAHWCRCFSVIKAATTIMADGARQGDCPGQSVIAICQTFFFFFSVFPFPFPFPARHAYIQTGSPIVSPFKCIHVPICRLKRCSRAKKAEMRHRQMRVGLALEPWPHHVIEFYGCRYVDGLVGPPSSING